MDFVRGRPSAAPGGEKAERSVPDHLFSTKSKEDDKKKKKKKKSKKAAEEPVDEADASLEAVMRQLQNVPKRVESLTFNKLSEGCGVLGVVSNIRKNDVRVVRSPPGPARDVCGAVLRWQYAPVVIGVACETQRGPNETQHMRCHWLAVCYDDARGQWGRVVVLLHVASQSMAGLRALSLHPMPRCPSHCDLLRDVPLLPLC